jgi:hypothetical protein
VRPRAKQAIIAFAIVCGGAAASQACRSPTQVTLDVTYSGPCSDLGGVALIVGTDPYKSEERIVGNVFTTSTSQCTPGTPSRIGTLVITPNENGDRMSIIVLAGIGKRPEECKASEGYFGCIIARRGLGFVTSTSLTLGVSLDADCRNVPCNAVSTCSRGLCVDSNVECGADGCSSPGALPDGGIEPVDAPLTPDAYVQADAPIEPEEDSAIPPVDSGVDAGFCEEPDEHVKCTTPLTTKTCQANEGCCYAVNPGGDGGGGDGGGSQYDCRPTGSCNFGGANPNVMCKSARNCAVGLVCCVVPMTGGGTSCMAKCAYPMGGPDGGQDFPLDQACADTCECRRGGTCSVDFSLGTSPPQAMKKCSQ